MAKPLIRSQPTSSVAGMLEPGIGARALVKPPERPAAILPTPVGEQFPPRPSDRTEIEPQENEETIPRQFVLTNSTDKILKKIVSIYGEATDLELKHSEFLRSVLVAVNHALPELAREAKAIGRLKRPKNDRAKKGIQDQMERKIAKAFIAGMRAVAALD